jgi:hypothetical protein
MEWERLPARQQTKRRDILVDRSELLGLTAQARHGEREIPEKVIGIPDDGFTRAESSTTSPLAAASTRTADSNRALRSVASRIQKKPVRITCATSQLVQVCVGHP